MDLFDEPTPADNTPEFSVSELSGAVKKAIEGEFSHVRVRGEVGRVSRPSSGHLYFDLKDDRSVLASVCWKGKAATLAHRPEEGMEVVATGRLTTFPGQSRYQLVVEEIAPAGAGALMAMLEKRKAMLAAEGLFAPERKRPLPYLPEVIGVVTSPSGAVIRDILHRLRERFPRKVLVWPVAVQGQRCAEEVAAAIAGFNRLTPGGALPRPDLLIVARGGGSLEDLWGFNEEIVARAAAASEIPLISAVGHETDTTLIDFVADVRAPTPTAAAELAVPVRMELLAVLDQQGGRLRHALTQGVERRGQRLRDLSRALPGPGTLVEGPAQRLDALSERLSAALRGNTARQRLRLSEAALRPGLLTRGLAESRRRLDDRAARLDPALQVLVTRRRERLGTTARALNPARLTAQITRDRTRLETALRRLAQTAQRGQERRRTRLAELARLGESLGYKATLERGYAVVRADGAVLTRAAQAAEHTALEVEFADGRVTVRREG